MAGSSEAVCVPSIATADHVHHGCSSLATPDLDTIAAHNCSVAAHSCSSCSQLLALAAHLLTAALAAQDSEIPIRNELVSCKSGR